MSKMFWLKTINCVLVELTVKWCRFRLTYYQKMKAKLWCLYPRRPWQHQHRIMCKTSSYKCHSFLFLLSQSPYLSNPTRTTIIEYLNSKFAFVYCIDQVNDWSWKCLETSITSATTIITWIISCGNITLQQTTTNYSYHTHTHTRYQIAFIKLIN